MTLTKEQRDSLRSLARSAVDNGEVYIATRPEYLITLADELDELENHARELGNRLEALETENVDLLERLEGLRELVIQ